MEPTLIYYDRETIYIFGTNFPQHVKYMQVSEE